MAKSEKVYRQILAEQEQSGVSLHYRWAHTLV